MATKRHEETIMKQYESNIWIKDSEALMDADGSKLASLPVCVGHFWLRTLLCQADC
jgi:hypothetical protein